MKPPIHTPAKQLPGKSSFWTFPGTAALLSFLTACSSPLVKTDPTEFNDSSTVTITCNAEQGNRGLKDFDGNVYVHIGLITDSSKHSLDWRYVKFNWGSEEKEALARPDGPNSWSYTIPGIRDYFGVNKNEKIQQIAILFREGNCIDAFCRVLRNKDKHDILIPLKN